MAIKRKLKKFSLFVLIFILVLFTGPVVSLVSIQSGGSKDNAVFQELANIDPTLNSEPLIQVYAARTWGIKGALAVHTWISTKRHNAEHYTNTQVIGWRYMHGKRSPLVEHVTTLPQSDWFGSPATLLLELRGSQYEKTIDEIEQAITSYPYADTYTMWPGPNSNTFTAYVARLVPELGLDLPATAIGKDYRPWNYPIGRSPSRTGVQASILGLAGVTVGLEEGIELNILSMNFEFDIFDFALELPGIGRIGAEPN